MGRGRFLSDRAPDDDTDPAFVSAARDASHLPRGQLASQPASQPGSRRLGCLESTQGKRRDRNGYCTSQSDSGPTQQPPTAFDSVDSLDIDSLGGLGGLHSVLTTKGVKWELRVID